MACDTLRHLQFAGPNDALVDRRLKGRNREAQIIKDYHRLEKGLALRSPRRPFGDDVARRLVLLMRDGENIEHSSIGHARDALEALAVWNAAGVKDDEVAPTLESLTPPIRWSFDDVKQFFSSRRSVRDFADIAVEPAVLTRAVSVATTAPSVCNRSPGRLHIYEGAAAREILAEQNGNAGFRESVNYVAVITVDRSLFLGAVERNQPWIDGGLFAMTFVMGLHAQGIATCFLNWSVSAQHSSRLRTIGGIQSSEDVICLVAFGHPSPGARVARSPRRAADEVMILHGCDL